MNGVKKIKLGIFGFGCVGQGLYNVLQQTRGINASIKKICIKHPDKMRIIDPDYFTTDRNELLNDPEIDVIVELIDDRDAAFEIVSAALKNKKAVVSANKRMIAEHFSELYQLQQEYETALLYEASCCASIPIIRNLEEYYDNDLLNSVEGIFNGSTNYILTKIFEENINFDVALKEAQEKGFAESDPTLDIEGYDPKFKLTIILSHAFGLFVEPEKIFHYGIQNLNEFDINYAREKNATIKLVAKCKKLNDTVFAYCFPRFVSNGNNLNKVNNEYNGVLVEGAFSENQFFTGKGAGGNPTGSAVLSDISALTYHYKYEYKKVYQQLNYKYTTDVPLEIYVRYDSRVEININEFDYVSVRFHSEEYNYIIGKINLNKLIKLPWLREKNVNIILTENNL